MDGGVVQKKPYFFDYVSNNNYFLLLFILVLLASYNFCNVYNKQFVGYLMEKISIVIRFLHRILNEKN